MLKWSLLAVTMFTMSLQSADEEQDNNPFLKNIGITDMQGKPFSMADIIALEAKNRALKH